MSSYLAGLAFNSAGLGINHSIAHGIGANFHLSHGCANAMLLPHVIAFNSYLDVSYAQENAGASERYAYAAKLIGLTSVGTKLSVMNLIRQIIDMIRYMNMPVTLAEAGVSKEDFENAKSLIVKSSLADVCTPTNPRVPEERDIIRILDNLYYGIQ